MAESLYIISLFFVVYTYIIYPCGVFVLSKLIKKNTITYLSTEMLPVITIVISVYNEEKLIENKIKNFLSINYPSDKLKFVIVSDGSTDNTNIILDKLSKLYINLIAVTVNKRKGKPNALNIGMGHVESNIVVFSDIRQTVSDNALLSLVSELESDEHIGLVSGELVHVAYDRNATSKNVGLYWRYEKWIRHSESRLKSTVGTTGALYMFYKADFKALREDTILDDFEIPMNISKSGKKLKISSDAFIYDYAHEDIEKEKIRKIRTLSGNYQSFLRMRWLFSPYKNHLFVQFLSHKVFRLLVPYFLIFILVINFMLLNSSIYYQVTLFLQLLFYSMALSAYYFVFFRKNKLANFCLTFVVLNFSVILALYLYIRNEQSVTWSKT